VLSVVREHVRGLEGGMRDSAHTRGRGTAQLGAGGGRGENMAEGEKIQDVRLYRERY
jgi:hypothetical protein